MMLKLQSQSRNHKAKGVKVKHAVKTCFVLAFSMWMLYQLKLFLHKEKGIRKTNLITSEVPEFLHKYMPSERLKLSRKNLVQVETEISGARNEKEVTDETSNEINKTEDEGEGNAERAELERMVRLDDQNAAEKVSEISEISDEIHGAEEMEEGSESSLVNGSDDFESFDSSESTFYQDGKEDNIELEILEETAHIEDGNQEDAADQ